MLLVTNSPIKNNMLSTLRKILFSGRKKVKKRPFQAGCLKRPERGGNGGKA
jgi:hypothetical protein